MAPKSSVYETRRRIDEARELLHVYITRAGISREQRRIQGSNLRQWYEAGTEDGYSARYNKLRAHLDRLSSYIWSPDSVRFGVHLPPATRKDWLDPAQTARDEFRQVWANSGADLSVSLALEWALVYGASPLKIQQDPQKGFVITAIDPWDFGVTREDQPSLTDQDIYCHWYSLSMPQFERWVQGHPRDEEMIQKASRLAYPHAGGSGYTRLVISGLTGPFPNSVVSGAMPGDVNDSTYLLEANVIEPVVLLCDVWERRAYHDSIAGPYEDWRVTTVLTDGTEPLVRRRNPILPWMKTPTGQVFPGQAPFGMLTPRPMPNYLWGRSELASLLMLQQWRERHVRSMDEVVQRQLDPSKLFIGLSDFEEAGRALSNIGGSYGTGDPNVKFETIKVEVGQEAFAMIGQIDAMFDDQSGIPPTLQGQQAPGVRSNDQLISMAGIGAGRIRHMALQLESVLSHMATLGFRILQHADDQTYESPQGQRFILAQLPAGLTLQVSAHSSSPIFSEQTQMKALELFKAGAIDGEWLIELMDPPHREEMKETSRRLAEGRAQNQQQLMQLAAARIERKANRLGPGRPVGS
jgi:hypothetical protein